jgi:PTH1 family peptidyl-tRNA hydrolase
VGLFGFAGKVADRENAVIDSRRWLVAGLGNPGRRYRRTRHNVGFMLIDRIAAACGVGLALAEEDRDLAFAEAVIEGTPAVLATPLAYMNRSGPPLQRLAQRLDLSPQALLVAHDDVDLVFGRIKIKEKGGDGGHRGVMSLIDAFGRNDFVRLRIGIGRPAAGQTAAEHVLSEFSTEEERLLGPLLERAREAAMAVISQGAPAAMNRFNTKEAHIHQVNS